jgi:hypothetical protein
MTAQFEITFTPISNNNCTVNLHNELVSKNTWRWSDGKHNKSKIGDYFAFYFHKKKIIFHKILDIIGPENKYSHWDYPGSQSKNILILSQPLHELDWNEWELLNGPQSHMSTYTTANLKKQRSLVYNYLVDHLI